MAKTRIPVVCWVLGFLLVGASSVWGEAYRDLVGRYEKQIRQQENQMRTLRAELQHKEREVNLWQSKAEQAKAAWALARESLNRVRAKMKRVRENRRRTQRLAEAAERKTAENVLVARSAEIQAAVLARELYGKSLVSKNRPGAVFEESAPELVLPSVLQLSASAQDWAKLAEKEEFDLRSEELHWQSEETAKIREATRWRESQRAEWVNWQEALGRKTALEDEMSELDQSAKALQVLLQDVKDHREQARALKDGRSLDERALLSLRGTLPWPAEGKIVQNFGRQNPIGDHPFVISNGLTIATGPNQSVRVIREGQVLYARPFREYGLLVIVQHDRGLTSVYGGLGQTSSREGQTLAALDPIGLTGEKGSFYFELRHEERPVNPLLYLTSATSLEIIPRRKLR
jgi:murein hydrolase activator